MRADRVPKYGQILRLPAPSSRDFRLVAPAERLTLLGVVGSWSTCECTPMRVIFFAAQH